MHRLRVLTQECAVVTSAQRLGVCTSQPQAVLHFVHELNDTSEHHTEHCVRRVVQYFTPSGSQSGI